MSNDPDSIYKLRQNPDGSFNPITATERPDGRLDLTTSCPQCGKPLTRTDKWRMRCEDDCGLDEDKAAHEKLSDFVHGLHNLMTGILHDD